MRKRVEKELKASQGQLLKQERIKSLGEIAAGVTHDINNSLTSVICNSELLLEHKDFPVEHHRSLRRIQESAQDISALVRRLQLMYRKSTTDVCSIDLVALISSMVETVQEQWEATDSPKKIKLQFVGTEGSQPMVRAVPTDIRGVVLNLLSNAYDAIENAGEIFLRCDSQNEHTRFCVADNGCGMSHEVQQNCFDAFYSTKVNRGSGIGLSTTQSIVRSVNYRLSARGPCEEAVRFVEFHSMAESRT